MVDVYHFIRKGNTASENGISSYKFPSFKQTACG